MGEDDKATPKAAPDLSGVSRVQDRLVLEQLVAHGDDLARRRHTLLFFVGRRTIRGPRASCLTP
jgi:hypothetical protein